VGHDDPWWWNNCAVACNFLFVVDITKLLTQSIGPIIIAGGLILIYHFCSQDQQGCPVPPCHAPSSAMSRMKWCNGHKSWFMGHVGHGSTVWWPISISDRHAATLMWTSSSLFLRNLKSTTLNLAQRSFNVIILAEDESPAHVHGFIYRPLMPRYGNSLSIFNHLGDIFCTKCHLFHTPLLLWLKFAVFPLE